MTYNRAAIKAGRTKKGDNTDAIHKGSKIVGFAAASKNRGDKNDSKGDKASRGKGVHKKHR